jgi:hypothetical protein
MDISFDLDTSWLKEEERLENISINHFREPLLEIRLNTVYIKETPDDYRTIDHVTTEKIKLETTPNQKSILTKERLLKIIQTKRGDDHKFMDILIFHAVVEHENIHTIANLENQKDQKQPFFTTPPIVDDIFFDDTLFIFHNTSTIYLLLQEYLPEEASKPNHKPPIKSILKTTSETNTTNKTKKKVQLVIPKKHGITKKNL